MLVAKVLGGPWIHFLHVCRHSSQDNTIWQYYYTVLTNSIMKTWHKQRTRTKTLVWRSLIVVISYTGPFLVRAEVTSGNTSIRVSWEWSCQGLPMYINHVRVDYQPEGGSLIMQTVNNTAVTSATLANLQCNTRYTIWIQAIGRVNDTMSDPGMVSLPARGICACYIVVH